MKELHLELELRSPVCLAQRPTAPGQLARTPSYLTGTTLRGAIAARWLDDRPLADVLDEERARFAQVFFANTVVFEHALPLARDRAGRELRTWVVPETAWTTKRSGTWQGDDERSGVQDVLPRLLGPGAPDELVRVEDEFVGERGGRWSAIPVQRRLITRVALTQVERDTPSMRGVAAPGLLYSFEALEPGQRFIGRIHGPDEQIDALKALLPRDTALFLGQGRSRGLGQVVVRSGTEVGLAERDAQDLAHQAHNFTMRCGLTNAVYLPITLESDVLLRDHYLLPSSSAAPAETLRRYLPGVPPSMRLHSAVQRTHWIGGWDLVRQLPRPPQLAVQMGSVWVFRVSLEEVEQGIAWWLAAERQGLGERRAEGYGRVRLLHPLHTEERAVW